MASSWPIVTLPASAEVGLSAARHGWLNAAKMPSNQSREAGFTLCIQTPLNGVVKLPLRAEREGNTEEMKPGIIAAGQHPLRGQTGSDREGKFTPVLRGWRICRARYDFRRFYLRKLDVDVAPLQMRNKPHQLRVAVGYLLISHGLRARGIGHVDIPALPALFQVELRALPKNLFSPAGKIFHRGSWHRHIPQPQPRLGTFAGSKPPSDHRNRQWLTGKPALTQKNRGRQQRGPRMRSLCRDAGLRRRQGVRLILSQRSRLPGPQGRIIPPVIERGTDTHHHQYQRA